MTDFSDDLVRPFAGLRAAPARASEIAAPPYDVINADEARELAKNKPYSFLHISRAEIDFAQNDLFFEPKLQKTLKFGVFHHDV